MSRALAEALNSCPPPAGVIENTAWWAEAERRYVAIYVEYFSKGYIVQSKK